MTTMTMKTIVRIKYVTILVLKLEAAVHTIKPNKMIAASMGNIMPMLTTKDLFKAVYHPVKAVISHVMTKLVALPNFFNCFSILTRR
jgi:hypothetical protein